MNQAYDTLHFVQAALPTIFVVVVLCLGILWASKSDRGRNAIVDIALSILRQFSKGSEEKTLLKMGTTSRAIRGRIK